MKLVKAVLQPVLICIIISLLGCSGHSPSGVDKELASTPAADVMDTGDGAGLFILNLSGWTLLPQDEVILDNGQEIASLPRRTFTKLIIPAGRHEFGFPYRTKPTLTLDAVKGEKYFIQIVHKSRTSWAYSIEGDPMEIKQISKEEAKLLLQELEPLRPSGKKEMESTPAADRQLPEKDTKSVMKKIEPLPTASKKDIESAPAAEERSSEKEANPAVKISESAPTPAEESTPPAANRLSEEEAKPQVEKIKPPSPPTKKKMVPAPVAEEMKTEDGAVLFILNLSGWTLIPHHQTVLDNGRELANLPRNAYTKVGISAGTHELGFLNRVKPTLHLDAVKGQTYYISIAYKPQSTWLAATATDPVEIKQLSEEEAKPLMRDLAFQ